MGFRSAAVLVICSESALKLCQTRNLLHVEASSSMRASFRANHFVGVTVDFGVSAGSGNAPNSSPIGHRVGQAEAMPSRGALPSTRPTSLYNIQLRMRRHTISLTEVAIILNPTQSIDVASRS